MDSKTFEKLYHASKPFSFGSKQRIFDNLKLTEEEINKNLKSSDIYTRYKQYKKPRKYSPIYVYKRRELFQADLIAFTNPEYIKANDGYKYLFTVIDVFTKFAWVYPLKSKDCETTKKCFEDILSKCGELPEKLQTDRGSEFICAKFKNFLKSKNIHHYVSYSDRKCPVVERFNLTIQQILYKILDKNESFRWIDYIDQAMKIYNSRKHTTIKLSPTEAEKRKNETIVRKAFIKRYYKAGLKPPKPKYKIGDTVRIWKFKRVFDRGYHENYTTQYFKISKVLTNLPVVRYELEDILGEPIIGSFFENELVPFDGMEFYRTEVIDSKGSGKNKKYLVHYLGWPNKFNDWVSQDQLKDINPEPVSDDDGDIKDDSSNVSENEVGNLNDNDDNFDEEIMSENNNELEEIDDVNEEKNDEKNDENEANMFYEPYQATQNENGLENNVDSFYQPYSEENVDLTNYDQSNENSFNRELRARKRKGSELNIQPSKLKVNFVKDNDSAKVLDMTEPLIVKQNRLNRKKKKCGKKKKGGKKK